MAAPRKPKIKKDKRELSRDERKILARVHEELLKEIAEAFAADNRKWAEAIESAGLSGQAVRNWGHNDRSASLKSLVMLANVVHKRPTIRFVTLDYTRTDDHPSAGGGQEVGAMPADDEKLSDFERGVIYAIRMGAHPPELTEPPGRQPGQPKK